MCEGYIAVTHPVPSISNRYTIHRDLENAPGSLGTFIAKPPGVGSVMLFSFSDPDAIANFQIAHPADNCHQTLVRR